MSTDKGLVPDFIKLLKSGVAPWNKWRISNRLENYFNIVNNDELITTWENEEENLEKSYDTFGGGIEVRPEDVAKSEKLVLDDLILKELINATKQDIPDQKNEDLIWLIDAKKRAFLNLNEEESTFDNNENEIV